MPINPLSQVKFGKLLLNPDGTYDGQFPLGNKGGASPSSWQLGAGNFIPAKMPLAVVYPRPDNETNVNARHRKFHGAMTYEVPIGVQGGAWPFRYEIVSAPAGATIQETDSGTVLGNIANGYGVLRWTPDPGAASSQSFVVRVTDQENNTVDVSWTAVNDDNAFVFIQDGWTGTKNGTLAAPLEDFLDYYRGSNSDSTYANKILVFRAGNYALAGDPSGNGNVQINYGTKAGSWIVYPGETAVIDCSTAKILSSGGTSTADISVFGLEFENARSNLNNSHFFWMTGSGTERASFALNTFRNIGPGTAGTDNPCPVFLSSTGALKDYFLFKLNTLDEVNTGGSNGSYVDVYYAQYVLIEENYAKNSNNGYGFWPKGTTRFVTVRGNEAWDNVTYGGITVGYGAESPEIPHDHEVCWNRVVLPSSASSSSTAFMWAMQSSYSGQTYNSYIYRNTFVNGSAWVRFVGNENYETDGNVVVSNNLNRWDTSIMTTSIANVTGDTSEGITDANGLLAGAYRTSSLNKAGAERSYGE